MKFEYWKAKDGWYFHFRSANGEIVFPSEAYTRKIVALQAIKLIKRWAADAKVVPRARVRK